MQDCNYIYAILFNAGGDSGIALVSARSDMDALQVLKNGGRFNAEPSTYTVLKYRNVGLSTCLRTEILMEAYTNAEGVYDRLMATVDCLKGDKGDPGDTTQSDWNQTDDSQLDYIKNKPTIPAAQVNADWNASSGVAQILNKPTIPSSVVQYTAQTLTDAQKSQARTNIGAGTYTKPSTGIPSSDMASAVQTSLGKADTAYQKPSTGIPSSDMASAVQTSLGKADSAYQKPSTGIPSSDMASAVQTSLGKADSAYQKPSGGVPKSDLASGVQDSLDLADSAVQAEPIGSIIPPVDPSEFATKEEVDELDQKVDDLTKNTDADFAIADENGNNLIECRNGHIKTKNFNSEEDVIPIGSEEDADLTFADEDENVLCELSGGHIKTKYFDSSLLPIKAIKKAVFMGDSITQGVYSYWNGGIHTDANRYNGFDISDATSVSQSTAYHGIHYYFAKYAGCKIVNLGKRGTGWVADTRNLGNALVVANGYSFADVDFVALFFGVNDYIQGKTIGTIGTSGTVRGNMASVIQKIANDNPLCKIVVYSPYNTFGQVSKGGDYVASDTLYGDESTNYALGYDYKGTGTLADYISAIDDVCAYYGVQHIKLSASNVVNRLTIKNIMIDGLHPSKEAYPMLAAEIYGKGNFGA